MATALMVGVILAVIAFNVTGGFHDAAEITAPGVVTRAIRPAAALWVFALMALIGPLVVGTAVADTISGVVQLDGLDSEDGLIVVLAATLGAVAWNVVTWRLAIPSSSTHALVGGLIGVTMVVAGPADVVWGFDELADRELTGLAKIFAALVFSPILGLMLGAAVFRLGRYLLVGANRRANRRLRQLQLGGTAALAFTHGANARIEKDGDRLRERNVIALAQAFSTDFDRAQIVVAIHRIDEVANDAKTTVRELGALGLEPDEHMASSPSLPRAAAPSFGPRRRCARIPSRSFAACAR